MDKKILVIVESPAKMKTLKKFLGKNFTLASSVGHIRDLPEKEFGIDTENDFEPKYVNLPSKKEVIQKLKNEAKKVDTVYLAPDPDREGEAIAWHISSILPKSTPIKRVVFYSITKKEVLDGINNPRNIDHALVDAQQARRLLDRIVGYKISPILTKKIRKGKKGTSAGRVQSVALKLVVEREKEIDKFVPIEYWNLSSFLKQNENEKSFEAHLYSVDGKRIAKEKKKDEHLFLIPNKKTADEIHKKLENANYSLTKVEKKEKKRNPVPPFITSTLQQEASRHYNFQVRRTMTIAQNLYEGIDLGEDGFEGLITYMRTDSVQVASEAVNAARKHIESKYGKKYLPEKPKIYSSKKSAQEAHEAIRPTNMDNTPESVKKHLSTEQYKIYLLIWQRFIASQMNSAVYDTVSAEIVTDNHLVLKTTGSTIKFSGFLAVYEEKTDSETEGDSDVGRKLPDLKEGQDLILDHVQSTQSFTKPPPRFTEASLVKELEKSGIGRPSTYASIMGKIQSRDYTQKERSALKPTELGKIIVQMLEQNFAPIMDIGFTAAMEDDLELIAEKKRSWKTLIKAFWNEFIPMVKKAEKEAVVPKVKTDIICPKCGKHLLKIWSQDKYFYGCEGYPECDYTITSEEKSFSKDDYDEHFDWDQKCPKCGASMNIRHGRYGAFLGCSKYPECKGIVSIPKKGEQLMNPEDRPNCPAIGCDGKIMMRRSRFNKIFYSCSNFPDCDVIVNNLDDLEKKYDAHHNKTPYQKKAGFRKGGRKATFAVSKELQEIVGEEEISRGDITKKLWDYIKKHKLQDPKNKRLIVPDAKLAKVFGNNEPIDMMQLARVISKHIKK